MQFQKRPFVYNPYSTNIGAREAKFGPISKIEGT
jgi:hypothetical protein